MGVNCPRGPGRPGGQTKGPSSIEPGGGPKNQFESKSIRYKLPVLQHVHLQPTLTKALQASTFTNRVTKLITGVYLEKSNKGSFGEQLFKTLLMIVSNSSIMKQYDEPNVYLSWVPSGLFCQDCDHPWEGATT